MKTVIGHLFCLSSALIFLAACDNTNVSVQGLKLLSSTPSATLWTLQGGVSAGTSVATAATGDGLGNIYVTGYTSPGLVSAGGSNPTGTQDLFLVKYDSNKNRLWAIEDGATSARTQSLAIAVDASGNIYIAGLTTGSLDQSTLHGTQDLFISKYSSGGVRLGTIQDGNSAATVTATGIAVDSSGFVYVTGSTSSSFVSGQGANSNQQYYINKYNAVSSREWTVLGSNSGSGTSFGQGIALDASMNVYVVGSTTAALEGNAQFGAQDYFIAKYATSGTMQWVIEDGASQSSSFYGTQSSSASGSAGLLSTGGSMPTVSTSLLSTLTKSSALVSGNAIAIDSAGDIFVAGGLISTASVYMDTQVESGNQYFISKYSSSGNLQWAHLDGAGTNACVAEALVLDSAGNVDIAGAVAGSLDAQSVHGATDLFITSYTSSGILQSTVQDGNTSGTTKALAIALDGSGHAYAAGSTNVSLDAQPQSGQIDFFLKQKSQ